MNRRGFLGACLAACAAPAIVRASSLMARPEPTFGYYEMAFTIYTNPYPVVSADPIGDGNIIQILEWRIRQAEESLIVRMAPELWTPGDARQIVSIERDPVCPPPFVYLKPPGCEWDYFETPKA